jgi:hypothetical protein
MYTRESKQLVDGAYELVEARRQARMYSKSRKVKIEYGQDGKTPGKSFDLTVSEPGKTTKRIDVYTPQGSGPDDIARGISHAAEKIKPGSKDLIEGTVCLNNWPPPRQGSVVIGSNGERFAEIIQGGVVTGQKPLKNYFDDIAEKINRGKLNGDFKDVAALNVIDSNGRLIRRLTNTTVGSDGGWK